MTDATFHAFADDPPRAASVPLPKPVPFSAPVLIGDVATPLAGTTVLALLWARLDRSGSED